MVRKPQILLVNPPIHDFAAYDFWARPYGLLVVGGMLEAAGAKVSLLDFTDSSSPFIPDKLRPKRKQGGHGKFIREFMKKPDALPYIHRRYSRYGWPLELMKKALAAQDRPDAVLVTSMMTYWCGGVAEAIGKIKEQWQGVPIILGGVYATLYADHARKYSGADFVAPGSVENSAGLLKKELGLELGVISSELTIPSHHLLAHSDAGAFCSSRGCPYRCPYCGVHSLYGEFTKYTPEHVEAEVRTLTRDLGIADIGLYDDAFLFDTDRALEIMDRITAIEASVRIHAASGLSCKQISLDVAKAMKRAGFTTIRLGLETADVESQKELGGKVRTEEFRNAVGNLRRAGCDMSSVGAYVMVAMPDQTMDEIRVTVEEILSAGIRPHLSEYSPVPQSPMFQRAAEVSKYDLSEPLYHNPTILPCANKDVTPERIHDIKMYINERCRGLNHGGILD